MTTIWIKDELQMAHIMHTASLMYDYVYDKANALFNEYDPCAVRNGMCISGRNGSNEFCCDGCKHLGENGCTTRALWCKLYLCNYCVYPDEFIKKLDKIGLIGYETWSKGLLWYGQDTNTPSLACGFRASKEETMPLIYGALSKYHTPREVKLEPQLPKWPDRIITNKPRRGYVIPYCSEEYYEYRQTQPDFFYVDHACITKDYF